MLLLLQIRGEVMNEKPIDNSYMKKGPDCDYDKLNISVVI